MSEKINNTENNKKENSLIHENYENSHYDIHENDYQTCFGVTITLPIQGSESQVICPDRINFSAGINPWPGPNGVPPYGIKVGVCYDF
jgi:hypothetical protein